MDRTKRIARIYEYLYNHYGAQGWWPGDSALECIIGAILTQNTTWSNVEKAIGNLKSHNLLSVKNLSLINADELAPIIKSSGYYNQKALKIKNFISFLTREYGGKLDKLFEEEMPYLRQRLLSIKGIGPETADSILLYAGQKPVFVVDAYTHRILLRHGIIPEQSTYGEVQEVFMDSLAENPKIYNEYHALLVKVGKEHCKKRNPLCKGCPLEPDPHTVNKY